MHTRTGERLPSPPARRAPASSRRRRRRRNKSGMVSGGRCLAFALRLPHGGNLLTRPHVVVGTGRPPLGGRRFLSTEGTTAPAAPAPFKGSSLFQRLSSFLAGVGVTSLVGFYFLIQDVKRSTESVQAGMSDITKRLEALEKGK